MVLAAGRSRRFGGDKRLAKLDHGQSVLQQSIELIVPHCSKIFVVLRVDDEPHLSELLGEWQSNPSLDIVFAEDADKGMGHSLAKGAEIVANSSQNFTGVLVMLGDMPYIAPSTLQSLIAEHEPGKITFPCLKQNDANVEPEKNWGHPVIFGKRWFQSLCELRGDTGARSIIRREAQNQKPVMVDNENILRDIDRPSDIV